MAHQQHCPAGAPVALPDLLPVAALAAASAAAVAAAPAAEPAAAPAAVHLAALVTIVVPASAGEQLQHPVSAGSLLAVGTAESLSPYREQDLQARRNSRFEMTAMAPAAAAAAVAAAASMPVAETLSAVFAQWLAAVAAVPVEVCEQGFRWL